MQRCSECVILSVDICSCLQQALDCLFGAIPNSTMKGCIARLIGGVDLHPGFDKELHDLEMACGSGFVQCRSAFAVQACLSGVLMQVLSHPFDGSSSRREVELFFVRKTKNHRIGNKGLKGQSSVGHNISFILLILDTRVAR